MQIADHSAQPQERVYEIITERGVDRMMLTGDVWAVAAYYKVRDIKIFEIKEIK